MLRMPVKTWSLVAVALLASLSTLSWGRANEKVVEFNIPAQALDAALLQFAQQADVQISVATIAIAGMKSQGVAGRLTPSVALARLLSETGLKFSTVGERTYSVSAGGVGEAEVKTKATLVEGHASGHETMLALRDEESGTVLADSSRRGNAQETYGTGSGADRSAGGRADLGEQVVTGSRIRNSVNAGAPLTIISREDIEVSGYSTVQEALKTLPQNVGGGVSEDSTTETNFNLSTSVNLRGLGADSTLILVNGNRQVQAGVDGSFVDISTIPAAMVERIEVLTDGASAIYGADAVGGVVNIILRTDYEGAETRVRGGSFGGDAEEMQLAQLFGTNWESGRLVFGYQYYDRDALASSDRDYTADGDKTPFGGNNFNIPLSNPGNIFSPFTFQPTFAIPTAQDGTDLTSADLLSGVVNLENLAAASDLLPSQKMHNAFLSASQQIGDRLELFAEGRYSTRDVQYRTIGLPRLLFVPASNAFFVDAFGGFPFSVIAYSFLDDLGPITGVGESTSQSTTVGVSFDFLQDWEVRVSGGYGSEKTDWIGRNNVNSAALAAALADSDPATAFNPYGDGSFTNPATLEAIRATQYERATSDVGSANILADGPIFDLPAGSVRLAIGGDHRNEDLVNESTSPDEVTTRRYFDRTVTAAFAELAVPVLGGNSGNPKLDLSLSGRHEDYSDFGTTVNPRIGVNLFPVGSLKLRGTWGTSFRAPKLVNLDEATPGSTTAQLTTIPDPQSGSGQSLVLLRSGNNAGLQEETATIWTAGIDYASDVGFSFSLTYYDIDYKDRVAPGGPTGRPSDTLLQEEQWEEIVNRDPSAQEIADICNSPAFVGSPSDCMNTPPVAIVDTRLRNLSMVKVTGFDIALEYAIDGSAGRFDFSLNGNYIDSFKRAATDSSPVFDIVDTVNNPVGLRLRAGTAWTRGDLGINAFINYLDSYEDDLSTPVRSVDSWTTVDLRAAYRTPSGDDWTSGTEISLSVVNAFDEDPPFVNAFAGYDNDNADPLGRVFGLQVVKSW